MSVHLLDRSYWENEWSLTDDVKEAILDLFLEINRPMTPYYLAKQYLARLAETAQAESAAVAQDVYNPLQAYPVGARLLFPQLKGLVGEVVAVREGHNPRYEPFKVIAVQFPNADEPREFVAEFNHPALLNFDTTANVAELTPDTLLEVAGDIVEAAFARYLQEGDFAEFGGRYLPEGMLVDVNLGNRNIAEAMIDIMGHPLVTAELMKEMELPKETNKEVLTFSVNVALSRDERFYNAGDEKSPTWHLHRLK
nr:hypothetical protein [Ardenticatena sp.]